MRFPIGGFIVAEAVRRGFDTYAAVRESTSRRYITDPSVKFVVLDYDDPDTREQAARRRPCLRRWDYVDL